ncbi:hypothetical protein MOQ72_37315 [Saccharopolyspora sp. K220]|uniref:hypothetical protein n=1 Tax=Saccharopolyspora soli TaxID=2926618 RepID=UPI001F579F2F|nr:hypothetical protein [Saccharopolyspora soli]MCI2423093.1 hypothetical protein [Saccharopolyspora soli]
MSTSTGYQVSFNIPDRPEIKNAAIEVNETNDLPGDISAKIAAQISARLGFEVGVQLCNKLGAPLNICRYDVEHDEITNDVVGTATINTN